ncbi:uri1, prefoldin-like chaperone [Mortierella alpina]|uniref:Uri1, prefoldin-like chaperone n=1 Tax=Mortierella alpina TaxID=64518 RepID=A0A9P6IYG1_MORAP|nr:uri1, prefoldin-like chaperone [Mortierella alpina]
MDLSQSADRQAEAAELAKYFSKFSAALTRLDEELARWKNYEADYQALKTTLLDLPKEISHPVMVPIGNLAFMPGKLVHTNEVLVMLGDNWFVDRSAVQAAEIVDRRMELVQENITKLKAQEDEIRNKSGMAPGLLGGQEYNEEGLPIVEITEPYYSEDEEDKDVKTTQPGLLPFSQKTPKEQAEDRAILDRIAELEREDEERERRREAGEIVTSDEETESDEDEDADYDDGESEDEFRPKALDSDEEYEEEVWEHSGNEDDEDDEEFGTQGKDNAASLSKKSVRFADQVAKATKSSNNKQKAVAPSGNSVKPKSPTDLYNQMRDRQQAVRSAGSGPMVNMANLESTFANMMTPSSGLGKAPVFETTPTAGLDDSAAPLKSALKPTPKKVSRFKQSRAAEPTAVQEPTASAATIPSDDQPKDIPPKKLSKFAQSRVSSSSASSTEAPSPTPVKPAVRGVSEMVFERNVQPVQPKQSAAAGSSEVVVKEDIVQAAQGTTTSSPQSVAGIRDVIENTFTKPLSSTATTHQPTSGRKKPSLFRQQKQQSGAHLEPEPAVPGSSFNTGSDSEDNMDDAVVRPGSSVPQVISASVAAKAPVGAVSERSPPTAFKAPSSSLKPGVPVMRSIPVVESSKLKDTALMKGAVVEHEDIEPVDEDELEEDMLMRQVVSEYQERRQAMIAKHGGFNREDIERMWEQQVVIPPGMIIPEPQLEGGILDEDDEDDEDDQDDQDEEEGQDAEDMEPVVDDRNLPPKKLSLFRAARLTGTLAKH